MGHHINKQKQFQSDKYPDLPPDKIILSFNDPHARKALGMYVISVQCCGGDEELADDIEERLKTIKESQ